MQYPQLSLVGVHNGSSILNISTTNEGQEVYFY